MADVEKNPDTSVIAGAAVTGNAENVPPEGLDGWIYRRSKIGAWTLTYYASPLSQILLLSFCLFLLPGMSNALSGLGGGGQLDPTVANNATVATYCSFAFFAFFSGSIINIIGSRWGLASAGIGYTTSVLSYICYNHTGNSGFVIFAGALAGFTAALLWTAQGAILLAYPHESQKGKYISLNWAIFNMGAVIGALIPLGQTIHGSGSSVGDATYAAFAVLMFAGGIVGLCILPAKKVVRPDGSRVILMKHPSWKTEFLGLWELLRTDYFVVLLFPMFLSSNWFYTYQFNDFNLAIFNARTRSLNNVIYWAMQIVASFVFGFALDWTRFSRPVRARVCWVALLLLTLAIWGGALKHQSHWSRSDVKPTADARMDWSSSGYGGLFVLYIFWGFYDAAWQTSIYWYMGSLSNSARKLAMYVGFYKSIQSAGSAIVYRLDTLAVSYNAMFGIAWGLLLGGLVFAFPLIWFKITPETSLEADLEFADEVAADVEPAFATEKA
ncbi:hypothetical protein G647_05789 [Cladophialophora carrionii CBS 160.54]|uniref:Major facilitator superfamily (MFS) profile domain-containing protein n=1 Tax=Cladophialophora carrionii CBS 160.54 TaxID=1279043 RepID=V9DDE8_9EURO|nr:uncharacterized protein G647_05789 [Cladophialophora carrionii CBS 160.54]ETI23982.1 hypothetical protein G647_05789 [Cladophialophora carrionii CBS 160.54]